MQSAFFPSQQQQGSKVDELRVHTSASSKRAAVTHTGSPTRHAAAGSISQSTCSSSRALRFPSSRRYLWDRTPAGPQVLIDVLDYLPHVQVAASTFGAISRAASNRASRVTLQLGLSVSSTNQVAALIQEHDPLSIQGALQLSCALSPPRDAAAAGEGAMRASMQAQVEQRDIARVHQLYVLSASAAAAASPAEPNKLALQLLMPRAGLLATPLYTKRLCHVPLAEALLKPGGMAAGQTGYLSMDQARSLLPLEATDSNVYSTPLVGVWVKGPSSVLHPLAAAACLRFACSSLLMDRAVNPEDGSFILLLCPEGDPVSKCFEVSLTDSTKLELCCYQLEASARSAGLSQCPGGLVSATWVPERCQVEPLPGPLAAAHGSTALLPAGSASGLARHSRAASATGTPSRAAAAYFQSRGVQGQSPAAADSPVLRGHGLTSRAGDLGLARSSAPSAAYGFGTAAQVQQSSAAAAATAARRSLPLTGYADSYGCGGQQGALGPAAGRLVNQEEQAMAAGLTPWEADEPQPRTGVPAVPYMQGSSAQGSSAQGSRQPWQQQQQVARDADACWSTAARAGYSSEQGTALSPATASDGALGATCSSPTKGSRQQQLTWSDRQDQVLRRSLEGAAEALRSSQASLAAARDAASGAGSRLGSPTKVRAGAAEAQAVFPEASLTQSSAAGAAGAQQDVDYGSGAAEDGGGGAACGPGYSSGPGAISGSPQPALSRLQHQRPQQQQLGDDAESDCGPRMGSPVRMSMLKKASLLAAAAAAHAAGVAAPFAPAAAAGTTGDQDADGERPVSPAVQAGVALSNLSLLQHLSAGQLQQDGHGGLEAVGEAAVAAATGSPVRHTSAVGAGASGVQHGEHQLPGQYRPASSGPRAQSESSDQVAAAQAYHAANAVHSQHGVATAAGAVVDSYNASHAAAAAIRAASSSMQRVPAHPYSSQSLGVQRYSADAAVMHNSSTGSPGGMGLLSPGSSPGLLRDSQHVARWTPLQQHQQQWQHQQQGVPARLPAAWSPGQGAAPSPGLMRPASSSGAGGGVDWQRQQRYSAGQQQQQLVSPVSVALSPGWVPDPVAHALQGEVDRLRQQLQQLQQQLKLAGMALPHPEAADAASGAATPEAGLALALPCPPAASLAAASAAAGSPIHVHNVYPVHVNVWMPGKQQQQHAEGAHTASAAGVAHQEEWELQQQILPPGAPHSLQEQHWAAHRYPAVSYAGTPTAAQQSSPSAAAALALAAPAAGGGGGADAGLHPVEFPDSSSKHHCAEGSAAAGSSTRANVDVGAPVGMPGAAAAAAKAAVPDEARQQVLTAAPASHGAAAHPAYLRRPDAPSNLQPASAPTQEQQQEDEGRAAAAAADAALLQQQQQQATASAARQRRRRLDFDAAAAAAAAAAAERSSDADSHGSPSNESDENAGAGKGAAGSAGPTSGSVSAAAGAAAAPHARESPKGGVTDPAPCSSPALKPTAAVKAAATVAAAAVESPAGAAAASRGALRSSAASSCAGVRYSGPRSSGAGLGHLRASLDAPPLVEVVRARMVDLSEDSDSDEWEDRLLVKYGLK